MNFLEITNKRFSVRKFQAKDVEQEKLDYIMQSVQNAPSACNKQPWTFYIVKNKELLAKLFEVYNRDWFRTAPICIVACGNHAQSWHRGDGKDSCDIDVSIAVTHLTLAATEQGLGTCWVCNFDVKKCAESLELEENVEPIALIPIGYADVEASEKSRKSLSEIFVEKF